MDNDMVRWWLKILKEKVSECRWIFEHTTEFCSKSKFGRKPNSAEFQISNDFCFLKRCNIFVELYWRVNFKRYGVYDILDTFFTFRRGLLFKQDGCRRRRHFHNEISRERWFFVWWLAKNSFYESKLLSQFYPRRPAQLAKYLFLGKNFTMG